ncbi:hypothetical protein B0A55_08186 [Friedmanniomyces simplex]|uniref:Homeobox domain-containing protein n=1 Tax=Friedmanniomyces simplex TaxID=329884 RepID=A0A4U0WWE9_9PEZI|nr:hypothetical protein B0A55_08186 [Friedmanniomyces simplex]
MEDQSVLEEAYKRDPKPDKAARLEIVKVVNLGEKEVQIWFQNRRQSSRRKSRPLLPHEIAQYQMSRHGPFVPGLTSASPENGERDVEDCEQLFANVPPSIQPENEPRVGVPAADRLPGYLSSTISPATSIEVEPVLQNHSQVFLPASSTTTSKLPPSPLVAQTPQTASFSGARSIPYPALRNGGAPPMAAPGSFQQHAAVLLDARDPGHPKGLCGDLIRRPSDNMPGIPSAPPHIGAAEPGRRLRKAPSVVRLSLSLDGNASVVTKDGLSPSPPRAPPDYLPPNRSGQTHSTQAMRPQEVALAMPRGSLERSSSGRARDSRAREFWCDKESRDELELKAEQDSSGSARDAISLLRSSSGRSILGALPIKRNSFFAGKPTDAKRSKLGHHRPSLQRANTSLGRLQSGSAADPVLNKKGKPGLKHSESALSVYISGNESDKENWAPDTERRVADHTAATTGSAKGLGVRRSTLGENRNASNTVKARSKGRESAKTTTRREAHVGENADPEADPELAAFMRGGRESNSTSSEADLDCVQGLLSLSQGNWR